MSPQVEAAIIAASVGVLTLIATVVTQYLGRRATSRDTEKTLDRTLAEQRGQLNRTLAEQRIRTLNERFATAAGQLGGDQPPAVQLAGVYAMAVLAGDWKENRQTCVDVLCGYLRIPYEPDPGDKSDAKDRRAFLAIREVRHTVIRVITAHLKDDAAVSWQGLNFDFTGVVFDGGTFAGTKLSSGRVDFGGAEFSGGTVSFIGAEFSGGKVNFTGAAFSGGKVYFSYAGFSGGNVGFRGAMFARGEISFFSARFSGSVVNFRAARFSGSTVDFFGAGFSGGRVDFFGAGFSGSTVDFNSPGDWSIPPEFPWTGTPPPGVRLPDREDKSQP